MAFDACRAAVVSMKLGLELFVISHQQLSESILTVDELKTLCDEANKMEVIKIKNKKNKMEVMLRDDMEEWCIDDEISDAVVSLKADLNVLICKENLYIKTSLMESKLKDSLGEGYDKSQIKEAVVSMKMDLKPLFCREEFRKLLVAPLLLEKRYPVRGKLISIKTSLEKEMEPLLRKEFQMLYNNVMEMESLLVASMGEDHNVDMAKIFQDQIRVVAGEVKNQLHFMDKFKKFDSNPLTLIRQWRGSVSHSLLKLTKEIASINMELKEFHCVSNFGLIANTEQAWFAESIEEMTEITAGAGGLAQILLVKVRSFVLEQVSLTSGVKDALLVMKVDLAAITAVIADAEGRQSREETLRVWLEALTDILYDLEDTLDEFECEARRVRVIGQGSLLQRLRHSIFSISNLSLAFRYKMGKRIKEIKRRMDKIVARKDAFNLNQQPISAVAGVYHGVLPETHSYIDQRKVIGRDNDRDTIVKCLLHPLPHNPYIVSIVGFGGLGKTTLAKLVFNDSRVEQHFQDKKWWVYVSQDFNLKDILQKFLNCATGQTCNRRSEVEQLQKDLRVLLEDKKFLVVLDDVWVENGRQWNELADLLSIGAEGSCLIVTTRSSKVSSIVRASYKHELQGLQRECCVSLFQKHVKVTHPELLEISGHIVDKCRGVPLVLNALAGLLRSNDDVRYWRSILDENVLSVLQNEDDVMPILRMSYEHLPPHLKRCFALCSLYAKGRKFWSVTFGSFWKSAGLIDGKSSDATEETCKQYMKELLARSLFHEFEDHGSNFAFKMHDLVHDLAVSVAQKECLVIKSFDISSIPRTIRHVSLFIESIISNNNRGEGEVARAVPPFLRKPNRLHTLMLRDDKSGNISQGIVRACISNCQFMRLLDLAGSNFEIMPSSIGTLKHLRLLNLCGNRRIRRLPDSICDLHRLQTFRLDCCCSLEELPREMWKLISLETISITTKQESLKSSGIGYLKSLIHLWIQGCNGLESLFEEGMDIDSLRGLYIMDCESLTSIPLNSLEFLHTLRIVNCPKLHLSGDDTGTVFPVKLHELFIGGCPQMLALPEWVQGSATTLQSLWIENCQELKDLPDWLQGFSHLKRVEIWSCNKLSSLPNGVQSLSALQHLEIHNCGELSRRCQPNGPEWEKIAHIPEIKIDDEKINY